MKKINFTKMAASGNDFVVVDNLKADFGSLARNVCARKTGIGADGLLTIDKSKPGNFKMRIFNPDGSEAEMCGNGARCLALYANKKFKLKNLRLYTKAGIIEAKVNKDIVKIKMSHPKDCQLDISVGMPHRNIKVDYIDSGVPHAVVFVEGLNIIDVVNIGRQIRYHKKFQPRGTNVDFVEVYDKDFISVRTYERGVEHETLACGTGVVASSLIAFLKLFNNKAKPKNFEMKVKTLSTEILKVSFDYKDEKFFSVWLEGKTQMIYKGEYYVK
ncbi:MAG: diaminopimelate epimerase [Candidatus Omnitrophota bacterium]